MPAPPAPPDTITIIVRLETGASVVETRQVVKLVPASNSTAREAAAAALAATVLDAAKVTVFP